MRLLRAELARLFARRFTKLMLLCLLAALAVVAAVVAFNTHRPSGDELRGAQQQAEQARADCLRHQEDVERFPDQSGSGMVPDFDCDDISAADYLPYLLEFREQTPTLLLVFFGLLAMLGYLVGASFLGADWSSGGMANLLLWRTQRVRVLLGKLTALLSWLFVTGLVLAAAWVGVIWLIARFRGHFGALTEGFWISLALTGARGMGLALLAAAFGAAVASLGRRTAAALGVLIGYLVVWEIGARIVMQGLKVPGPDRFVLSSYVVGLLNKRYAVHDWGATCFEFGCPPLLVITWWLGALVLGGLTVLAVLVATLSFRRRDIA